MDLPPGIYMVDTIPSDGPSGATKWGTLVIFGAYPSTISGSAYRQLIYFPNYGTVRFYVRNFQTDGGAWKSY